MAQLTRTHRLVNSCCVTGVQSNFSDKLESVKMRKDFVFWLSIPMTSRAEAVAETGYNVSAPGASKRTRVRAGETCVLAPDDG